MAIRAARFLILFVLMAGCALAQSTSDALLAESESRTESVRAQMKAVQAVVGTDGVDDAQLQQQRSAIDALKLDSAAEIKKLGGPLNEVQEQLKRLGPAPEAGTSEAPAMAAQRRLLDTRVARLVASQTQLELIQVEADQTVTRILSLQRDRFFDRIFRSDKSILNPGLWVETWSGARQFASRISDLLARWWITVRDDANVGGLLLLPAAGLLLVSVWQFIKRRVRSRFKAADTDDEPQQMSALPRLMRVAAGLLAVLTFVVLGNALLMAALDLANLMTLRVQPLFNAVASVFSVVVFNTGLAYLLCSPRRPEARLIAVDDRAASSLPVLIGLTSLVYEVSGELRDVSNLLNLPVNLTAGQIALSSAAMIALLAIILIVLRRQANREVASGQAYYLTWFMQSLPLIWVLLGASAFALVIGYLSLSYFIVGNIFDTALFAVVFAIIHYLADAMSGSLLDPASRLGTFFRGVVGLSERGISRLSLLFRTGVDIMLVLIAIPVLVAIWALTWVDVTSIYAGFFNGFSIGNISLSPWGILVALAVLALGVLLTRFVTGWLQRRVLAETTMDHGVQASITTASSYAGYIIAAALALSAAGLDFSNIAIVAGALGVGIGFGLQSIVNNFVSGLILLAERPVRVGDWVVTTAGEGIVRKINVRSTEIETFDSCTVIVPNSNLVTDSVKNWTHRDTVGRFTVTVTVEGGSNADAVSEALREILRAHPKVLRYPEPQILLARIAAQGLEFELKGHVSDVFEAAKVASDIRLATTREFAARRIGIAFAPTAASTAAKKPKGKA